MSTAGLVLILAVLLLGGGIATAGDRLGTKVGKAKLSLFNLRPRQTATVVTILSGITISASTLGVLFAASESLRDGVFRLDKIQRDLRVAHDQLDQVKNEKQQLEDQKRQVEEVLTKARQEQTQVQTQLQKTRQALESLLERLKDADQKQALTAQVLGETQDKLSVISKNYDQAQDSLKKASQEAAGLESEIRDLQTQRESLVQQRNAVRKQISKRDQEIAKLDQDISDRDRTLASRESQLKDLEKQRQQLTAEVETLNQNFQVSRQLFQELRRGNVALLRNQVLYKGVVTELNSETAAIAADQLLQSANTMALQQVRPGASTPVEQIIQITTNDVNRLVQQLKDGRSYVVRVLSAGNYLVGEKNVVVFVDVIPNQLVFQAGEQVATTIVDSSTLSDQEIIQRVEQLLAASQFRAQRSGVLADDIEINIRDLTDFVEKVKVENQQLDIKAVTAEGTYTAGPLRLQLIAARDGEVLFRSNQRGVTAVPPRLDSQSVN